MNLKIILEKNIRKEGKRNEKKRKDELKIFFKRKRLKKTL